MSLQLLSFKVTWNRASLCGYYNEVHLIQADFNFQGLLFTNLIVWLWKSLHDSKVRTPKLSIIFKKSIFHLCSLYSIFLPPTQKKLFFKFYFMTPPLTFYYKLKKIGLCISSHLFLGKWWPAIHIFSSCFFHLNYSTLWVCLILCSYIILQFCNVYSSIFLFFNIWGISNHMLL